MVSGQTRAALSLEASLRRLKTEHVDIYVYHSPPDLNEAEGVARYLESAKQKGHVRAIGISTAKFEMAEYLHSIGALDIVQFPENMVDRQPEFRSLMARNNVGGVLVRGAFAGGRLSGKYFHQLPEFGAAGYPRNAAQAAGFREIRGARKAGCSWTNGGPDRFALAARSAHDAHDHLGHGKTFGDYRDAAMATESPAAEKFGSIAD